MTLPDLTFRLEDTVPLGGVQPMLSVLYTKSVPSAVAVGDVVRLMDAEIENWCRDNMQMKGVYVFAYVEAVPGHELKRVTVNCGILGRN